MKKIFENVVLAEFTVNSGKEPFVCFQEESGKAQRERLLNVCFDNLVVPIFEGTTVGEEVEAMKPKEKAEFVLSVIDELHRLIIEPNLAKGDNSPDVTFAVCLMAMYIIRAKDKLPLAYACKAVRLETFAPRCKPSLNPDRVRTFAEEIELQGYCRKLDRWGNIFAKMCRNVCKP